MLFPRAPFYDLLRPDEYERLARNPHLLREEIAAEGLVRNLPAFGRFLEAAAFSNGGIVNSAAIARECGVSAPTVRQYFEILSDTLVGRFLPAFRRRPKRRVILAPKFYFFDLSLANHFLRRSAIRARSESFGHAFEHLLFQELSAHRHYSGLEYDLAYWRTASGYEVDFILGAGEVAIEVKGRPAHSGDTRGLSAFLEEQPKARAFIVSTDPRPRRMGKITVLPWRLFLDRLWCNKIVR